MAMPALLASTKEYFDALRDHKYVLFLDWPSLFEGCADDIVEHLTIGWLEYGFTHECYEERLFVLQAVNKIEPNLLKVSNFLYSLMLIISALTLAHTYKKMSLNERLLAAKSRGENVKELIAQMTGAQEQFSKILDEELGRITSHEDQSAEFRKKIIDTIKTIKPITDLLSHIKGYENYLGFKVNNDLENQTQHGKNDSFDPLLRTRLSWVLKLFDYVRSQIVLDARIKEQIDTMVQEIRLHHPSEEEKEFFLNPVSSLSAGERLRDMFSYIGRFFISPDNSSTQLPLLTSNSNNVT